MEQTENPFSGAMQHKSDEQLLQIVGDKREDYQPLAIVAAVQELEKRNVRWEAIQQAAPPEPDTALANSKRSFEWYHKAGMLLLPFFIGFLFRVLTSLVNSSASLQFLGFPFLFLCYYLLYHQLKKSGYAQMATDFKHWTSYTLYIYIGILALGAVSLLIAMLFA